jgi:hypothetical protein
LPGYADAEAESESSPESGDVKLVTVGALGGAVRTVTEAEAIEHAFPLELETEMKQV